MRIDVVGAGVAGLSAAVALQQAGHDVAVHEQASSLRATGFGLNLWSNAGSVLARLGVDVPGEPFDRVQLRAAGRRRAVIDVTAAGTAHCNVERGALLSALLDRLRPGTVHLGSPIRSAEDLLVDGCDLVVAADGGGSRLRPTRKHSRLPVRRRCRSWTVWQAVIENCPDELPPGNGAVVVGPRCFAGIWRLPGGGATWFVEWPALARAHGRDVVAACELSTDPLLSAVARCTPAADLSRWDARDRWPPGPLVGPKLVVVGDAAHPMLPCIGQGACQAIEDAATLTDCLQFDDVAAGLRRYSERRLGRVSSRVLTARAACTMRRPTPLARALGVPGLGHGVAAMAAPALRALSRPVA